MKLSPRELREFQDALGLANLAWFGQMMIDAIENCLDPGSAFYWIASNLKPDDVFSTEQLGEWAAQNGYVPEEE